MNTFFIEYIRNWINRLEVLALLVVILMSFIVTQKFNIVSPQILDAVAQVLEDDSIYDSSAPSPNEEVGSIEIDLPLFTHNPVPYVASPAPTTISVSQSNTGDAINNMNSHSNTARPSIARRLKLIRADGDTKVYYVSADGIRKYIPSPEVFMSYGNRWQDVVVIPVSELSMIQETRLIRGVGDTRVYIVENGLKRWITSASVFDRAGYSWSHIVSVNNTELNSYPDGALVQ